MRPTLNAISQKLTTKILDESKRLLSEIGMEIRGSTLRDRLLDYDLKTNSSGKQILFPANIIHERNYYFWLE